MKQIPVLINTIYRSTEGEGIHVGSPQIFVRFQGCAIGCVNCDSKETWDFKPESALDLDVVLEKIEGLSKRSLQPLKRVSITGGDPLHPQHVPALLALVTELKFRSYWINLEASGARIVDDIFRLCDFISFDFKTPSTGVRTSLDLLGQFISTYSHKGQIKAVIADKSDFGATLEAKRQLEEKFNRLVTIPWVLTPCYNPGEKAPLQRFKEVVKVNEDWGAPFKVIGQQHKWLYGPDAQNV